MSEQSKATLGEAAFLRHIRDIISPPLGREPYEAMTPFERETLNSIGARLILLSASAASEPAPAAWSPISKTGLLRGIRYGKPTEQDLLSAEADGDTIRYFYEAKS